MITAPPMRNNVLAFPHREAVAAPEDRETFLSPSWSKDIKDVGLVKVSGYSTSPKDIIRDGDTLVLKLRFLMSELQDGSIVVATLPDGRKSIRKVVFEHGKMILRPCRSNDRQPDVEGVPKTGRTIDGIVMEINRKMALAS